MKRLVFRLLIASLTVMSMTLMASAVFAQNPPSLPFNYRLEYAKAPSELPSGIDSISIEDVVQVNNGSDDGLYIVGGYRLVGGDTRGFIYHFENSAFIDMPALVGLAAPEFIRCRCYDMNETGIVVASIRDANNLVHAVYFDLFEPGTPLIHSLNDQFVEIPPPSDNGAYPYRINSLGDIVMSQLNLVVNPFTNIAYAIPVAPASMRACDINVLGTVLGFDNSSQALFRYNVHDSNSMEFFPFPSFLANGDPAINNFDEFCTTRDVSSGKPRNQVKRFALRYGSQVDWYSDPVEAVSADSINDSGDVCGETYSDWDDAYLHYSSGTAIETGPTVELQSLITDPFFVSGILARPRLTNRIALSPTLSAPIVCGWVSDAAGVEDRMFFLLPEILVPPTTHIYSRTHSPSLAIPDLGTVTSSIDVPDNFLIADLNVTLNINHQRAQDLDVFLIGPGGTTRIELFTDVGGNGVNFTGTTLDDEATTAITSGTTPFTGSFRPERSLGALDGLSTLGLWKLEVTDDKALKTGTIVSWSFTVETP